MTRRLHSDGETILYGGLSGLAATLYTLAAILLVTLATGTLRSNPIFAEGPPPYFVPLWAVITLYLLSGSFLGSLFAVSYHYWPTRASILKSLVLVLIFGSAMLGGAAVILQTGLTLLERAYLYLFVYAVSLGWIYSRTKTAPG